MSVHHSLVQDSELAAEVDQALPLLESRCRANSSKLAVPRTSGIRAQGFDTLYPQDSYCLAGKRGPYAFDTRHRIVTSVVYDLPVGEGKRLGINNPIANTVFGDGNLGGILTLQSGMPGNVNIGGVDNASTGWDGYDRPNATGISPYLDDPPTPDIGVWMPLSRLLLDSSAMSGAMRCGVRGLSNSTSKYTSNSTCRTRKANCSSSGLRLLTFSTTQTGRRLT